MIRFVAPLQALSIDGPNEGASVFLAALFGAVLQPRYGRFLFTTWAADDGELVADDIRHLDDSEPVMFINAAA
jgi:hypothetical protein